MNDDSRLDYSDAYPEPMTDLEKFLNECEKNSTHGCGYESCPPMHKLLAMVRYLLNPPNSVYTNTELNKIAKGKADGKE